MDLTNMEMCLAQNYEKAHDPEWLFKLLQEKILFLEDDLSAKQKVGVVIERQMI
jgi:hypothetical protein